MGARPARLGRRSGRALAALVLLSCACRDRCGAETAGDVRPPGTAAAPQGLAGPEVGEARVWASDREPLALEVSSVEHRAGALRVRARGPRQGWLYDLELEHALAVTDLRVEAPVGGGACRVRYPFEGRATEADFVLGDVEVRRLPAEVGPEAPVPIELRGRCTKLFDRTRGGRPYAAPLPQALRVTVRLQVPAASPPPPP